MFSLTIVFGPGPMVWTLMFKTREAAEVAVEIIEVAKKNGDIHAEDDFGQKCKINPNELHGYMLEDLEQSRLAHIERALHQARTQAKGTELADADPVLRQARMKAQGGLGMIQPVPGGMMTNGRFPS